MEPSFARAHESPRLTYDFAGQQRKESGRRRTVTLGLEQKATLRHDCGRSVVRAVHGKELYLLKRILLQRPHVSANALRVLMLRLPKRLPRMSVCDCLGCTYAARLWAWVEGERQQARFQYQSFALGSNVRCPGRWADGTADRERRGRADKISPMQHQHEHEHRGTMAMYRRRASRRLYPRWFRSSPGKTHSTGEPAPFRHHADLTLDVNYTSQTTHWYNLPRTSAALHACCLTKLLIVLRRFTPQHPLHCTAHFPGPPPRTSPAPPALSLSTDLAAFFSS
ncbi:hypothetical protein SVAN01_06270 [Stagonosporopsis vannaccii]|nr:hypothetical protein SVAN01_06270 [Stagonosporopsis vannaccii]